MAKSDSVPITATISRGMLDFIDAHALRLAQQRDGALVSRADAIRELLGLARRTLEAGQVKP